MPEKELRPGRIDAWVLDLRRVEFQTLQHEALLTRAEQDGGHRFHFRDDRVRFVGCRGVLRFLLGQALRVDPKGIELSLGPQGKPRLARRQPGHSIQFNVAHSGDLGLICLTREHPVGCDVERIQPDFDVFGVAPTVYTDRETRELRSLPSEEWARGFFRAWTAKEAFVKALGTGLSHPLRSFEVSAAIDAGRQFVRFQTPEDSGPWWVEHLEPEPEYLAAVAQGNPGEVHWQSWPHDLDR